MRGIQRVYLTFCAMTVRKDIILLKGKTHEPWNS